MSDGDGDIDVPTMFGTRSYSIWEVQPDDSLKLVHDSGSLEPLLLQLDKNAHNINRGETPDGFDTRSDDKGPEPEGLSVFTLDGMTLLALMLERQNGILLFDTDPNSPQFLDYVNTYASGIAGSDPSDRLVLPEGSVFISAADSPTGGALLLVGYEGHDGGDNDAIIEGGIGVFSIPEPGSAGLAVGGLALLGLRRRRS
ncbi:MAG TPA: PEP-CTERM sorting domain-containing protein [Chthoniobacterales bacterium]